MTFTDIRLQNFRSYGDSSFELGPGVTIVVGPNAAGKTNLIEALLITATGRSYRTDENLICDDKEWARIDVHTSENEVRSVKLQKELSKTNKEFIVEEKTYKRLPQSKKQPVVLFEPNDLMLLHGDPSGRRKYMDTVIGQMSDTYTANNNKYKRALAQRNALLKKLDRPDQQLFVWDVRLSEIGGQIVAERQAFINDANEQLAEIYSLIAQNKTDLKARYESKISTKNYANEMMKKLTQTSELDVARGFTGTGPHRDDLGFVFGDKHASSQASRGETRSLILALKTIELRLLEKQKGLKPLLLLDDVFSELDGLRRKALTNYLQDYQTVITTTDADVVLKNFSKKCLIIALQSDSRS